MQYDSSLPLVLESRDILEQWSKYCYEIYILLYFFNLVTHLMYTSRIISSLPIVRYVLLIENFCRKYSESIK